MLANTFKKKKLMSKNSLRYIGQDHLITQLLKNLVYHTCWQKGARIIKHKVLDGKQITRIAIEPRK